MTRVVKFPIAPPTKLGPSKVRKKGKPNPEDYGQLNLFETPDNKVISLNRDMNVFEEAMRRDEAGDTQAQYFYELAIEQGDNTEDALCNLGILLASEKKLSQAMDAFTRCLTINPRHTEGHYNLANLYADLGNLPLAQVHYEMAISISPDYPNSYYNLALIQIAKKEYQSAINSLLKYNTLTSEQDLNSTHDLLKTLKSIAK